MKIYRVKSTNILAVGYDPATRKLQVYFPAKFSAIPAVYQYSAIQPEMVTGLLFAESPGKYFSECIKTIPSVKLSGLSHETALIELQGVAK